jgi:phage terminase large subunit
MWSKMAEIFSAIEAGHRKILVRSCNGAGKTTAVAALCNWKLSQFEHAIVLTTASSWMQVRRTLWGEIRRQARSAELYKDRNDRLITLNETSIKLTDKHYAIGISPDRPENAQGFHAPSVLIAVDEATGVDREIIDALSGNLTGEDAQIVLICNPINMQSYPYEAESSGDWHLITISAFDHPNVKTGIESIPGAVTRRWIEDRLCAWSNVIDRPEGITNEALRMASGENSNCNYISTPNALYISWLDSWYKKTPIVASRICGEWADNDAESFIPIDLITASAERSVSTLSEISNTKLGIRSMGVDVARLGMDATVFAYFVGDRQLPFELFYNQDTMQTAAKIRERYDSGWRIIAVDDTGIGGGANDRLKELNVPVHAINFGQKPQGFLKHRKNLLNARAEMYFVLEEELRERSIMLLDDTDLHQELAAIRLTTSENGLTYRMEDKLLIRKRLGRSPDRADATALARYAVRLEAYKKLPFF